MKLHTYVAGTRYNNRTCGSLRCGQTLRLVPEPDNPADSNAIRIETLNRRKVGYVPRHLTATLKFPVKAVVDPKGLWAADPSVWVEILMEGGAEPMKEVT